MAINYPTTLDNFTNPTSTDTTTAVDHAVQHSNINDAVEALEAKVGVNSSAVTTSHDYKLSEVTSGDKAVGKTATQTLTNKTIDGNQNTITNVVGIPGGSNTQLQYNNSSVMAGISGATSDGTNVTFGSGNLRATSPRITTSILDANGNGIISFNPTASATANLQITNSVGSVVTLGNSTASQSLYLTGGRGYLSISGDGAGSSSADRLDISIPSGGPVTISSIGTNYNIELTPNGSGIVKVTKGLFSSSATAGLGYTTGAGGTVTQATSRTTGVTLNKVAGAITLVSAAGSTTPATFTVTNSTVAATDTIIVNQKSGTDLYTIDVTRVASGAFDVTFNTKSGTTTEQPVFNFAVIKAVTS